MYMECLKRLKLLQQRFVKEENISDEELEEILSLIDKGTEKRDISKQQEL